MNTWLAKLTEYAPDIVGAIASGGATLAQTALRIISKEVLGYETDNSELVSKKVESMTTNELSQLRHANNQFILEKLKIEAEDRERQRADIQHARASHKHHWMPSAICVVLTLGLLAFTCLLFFAAVPDSNMRMLDVLFGAYLTAWLSSVNYWVSSSRSSAEKTSMLSK